MTKGDGRRKTIPEGTMFNRLKVMYESPERNNRMIQYVCECQCNEKNIVTVTGNRLRTGATQSCGCLKKERVRTSHKIKDENDVDLTNATFGSWKVKRRISGVGVCTLWECECACGTIKPVQQSSLTGRISSSCGCERGSYSKENIKKNLGLVDGTNVSIISSENISKANTSGVKGVSLHKKTGKLMAYIGFKNKRYYLGLHDTVESAQAARQIAEKELYGNFIEWYNKEYNSVDKAP